MGVILIKPMAPLHLGEATGALERISGVIHSDTLFSALCHAWGYLFGKDGVDGLLAAYANGGHPIRISSAFPYTETNGECGPHRAYYLPAPPNLGSAFGPQTGKEAKKLRYITATMYRKWLDNGLAEEDLEDMVRAQQSVDETFEIRADVHVALDRPTLKGLPYYVSRLHCRQGGGFYFLYECDPAVEKDFRSAMRFLGDLGIGGERSTGSGAFEPEFLDSELLPSPGYTDSGAWLCLSLAFPREDELDKLKGSQIALLERKGWISSPFTPDSFRRKRLLMIAEGSFLSDKIEGCIVDVTPSIWKKELHPVYRYGLAWLIPARSVA